MAKPKKKFILLLVIFIISINCYVYGSINVVSVTPLDISKQIKGENAQYILDIPPSWKNYVSVKRETPENNGVILEKLLFYYQPQSAALYESLIMNLLIIDASKWEAGDYASYIKAAETQRYVVVFELQGNPYVFGSDKMIFDNLNKEASKQGFFTDYLTLGDSSSLYISNIVTVNGKRMPSISYANSLKVVYVPVREVCEELGYSVGWNPDDKTVSISSGSFYTNLGSNLNVGKKYNILNIGGKSYVSTMFFLQLLKCGVEIDSYNNVRISK